MNKPQHFRKKEKNFSFPSGDAIQSALFVFYLHHLGLPLPFLAVFHVGVCFGRVYYMCHWFMDTIASTFLGFFIGVNLVGLLQSSLLRPLLSVEL